MQIKGTPELLISPAADYVMKLFDFYPSISKNIGKQALIHCWWEHKVRATLENSLAVSYKSKHTPYCIPKVTENLYPQKILTQFKK